MSTIYDMVGDEEPGQLLRRRRIEERYSLRTLSLAMGGISGKDRIAHIERGLFAPDQVRSDEIRAFHELLAIPIEVWLAPAPRSEAGSSTPECS